ncbi:MAG: hypothetical protein J0I06_00770 [Planctomycetes bacterium]|nr:hypothetical protein [Planctomycetota bacterium]
MRFDDAQALLGASRWSAAYYLTGYAVECGLKSCVLKHVHDTGAIFADEDEYLKKLSKCRTHDLELLVSLAGLDKVLGPAIGANPALGAFWAVAKDWEETSRYHEKTEAEAKTLFEAITHNTDGVLTWLRQHW